MIRFTLRSPICTGAGSNQILRILRARFREEEGQSLIEFAVALTVFVVILLGAVEFGRLAYASIEVSSSAGAGAAYGARNAITAGDTAGMQNAATNDGADIASWMSVGLHAVASETCSCSNGTVITCANSATLCVSPARVQPYVEVDTSATVDPLFYVPGLPKSYTLTGKTILQVQQ